MTIEEALNKMLKNLHQKDEDKLSEEEIFDLECVISQDVKPSLFYAQKFCQGRFPLGESIISIHDNEVIKYIEVASQNSDLVDEIWRQIIPEWGLDISLFPKEAS